MTSMTKLSLTLPLETLAWDSRMTLSSETRALLSLRANHSRHPTRDIPHKKAQALALCSSYRTNFIVLQCFHLENWDSSITHCLNKGLHVGQSLFANVPWTIRQRFPRAWPRVLRDNPANKRRFFTNLRCCAHHVFSVLSIVTPFCGSMLFSEIYISLISIFFRALPCPVA